MGIILPDRRFEVSDLNNEIIVTQEDQLYQMQIFGQDTSRDLGRCKHCGSTTLHLTRKIYHYPDDYDIRSENYLDVPGVNYNYSYAEEFRYPTNEFSWLIQECMNCKGLLLKECHSIESDDGIIIDCKIIYPITMTLSDSLPSTVKKSFEKALNVKGDPPSFALLAGQTLEFVCRYEKAKGKNFKEKLDYLAQQGRIPSTLADMGQQIRSFRNKAAHDAEYEFTEKDVPIILEFLEAFLEYLYIAPAKIEAVRKRLDRNAK
jgi:hypothetical protein